MAVAVHSYLTFVSIIANTANVANIANNRNKRINVSQLIRSDSREFNGYTLDELRDFWRIVFLESGGKLQRAQAKLIEAGLYEIGPDGDRGYGRVSYTKGALDMAIREWPADRRSHEWTFADALTKDERAYITQDGPIPPLRLRPQRVMRKRTVKRPQEKQVGVETSDEISAAIERIDAGVQKLLAVLVKTKC